MLLNSPIINFVMSTSAGNWFDTEDTPVAFYIWPNTGDILIKVVEGISISGDKITSLSLETGLLVLNYKDGVKQKIACVNDEKGANTWLEKVNTIYRSE